jgi:hypothetical protein
VSSITYDQVPNHQSLLMKRDHIYGPEVIVGTIGVVLAVVRFYAVRELVAALIIFTILFGTLGMALLTLVLIQRMALKGLNQIESCVAYVRARHAVPSKRRHALRSPRWN